jgi:hypothetical protein
MTEPDRRIVWLELARRWMMMLNPNAPETETEQFDAAVQDKGTGQGSSGSSN